MPEFSGRNTDTVIAAGLHSIAGIRAKHQEAMRLYEWMAQAVRDARNSLPAVFHRKNHADILVTMRLDDWMKLYSEYAAGFDLPKG